MIVLAHWYGQLGNNLLSVLNAIHLAVTHGHTIVRFPPHELFTQTEIRLSDRDDNPTIIPMANMNPGEADPKLDLHTLRQYFQAHVKDVCTVTSCRSSATNRCISFCPIPIYMSPTAAGASSMA